MLQSSLLLFGFSKCYNLEETEWRTWDLLGFLSRYSAPPLLAVKISVQRRQTKALMQKSEQPLKGDKGKFSSAKVFGAKDGRWLPTANSAARKNTTAAAACHHCCQISDPTALFFSQIYEKGKLCGSEIASVDLTYNGAGWQWDTEKGIIWVDGISRFVFLTKFKTSRIGGSSSK